MNKYMKYSTSVVIMLFAALFSLSSCKDFFDPDQGLVATDEQLFNDYYEYRSVAMGLYGLQQKLVEQLVVLGELRGDLLTITPNADEDLVEIYNFNVSKTNKYASPTNFFKLIASCNNLIRVLEREHPEVLGKDQITVYDQLYGEAMCMRAWAYFTAVRIYGKVPFIPSSLVTMDEILAYVNSSGTYIDSVYIEFSRDGFYNTDTVYNKAITLEKKFYDIPMVIDYFTNELENKVRAVGVKHDINVADQTWEVTIWNEYAKDALLGLMYLTEGDLHKAAGHFEEIIKNPNIPDRYQIKESPVWPMIFFGPIDNREHIYTIKFDKSNHQQNGLNNLFIPIEPYHFMLKPTKIAVHNWETTWYNQVIFRNNTNPARSHMISTGNPGDIRGHGLSYLYFNGQMSLNNMMVANMLRLKSLGDTRGVNNIMFGMDTIVMKYFTLPYEDDANFILYRAGSIHLYMAEIYTHMIFNDNGTYRTNTTLAKGLVNDGYLYYSISLDRTQLGVRGRVGLGSGYDQLTLDNIQYIHDPFTNEITGYIDLGSNFLQKQLYFEENLIEERARECAFEGERFYDLMRVAKRRNDPSFLAAKVSAKYPSDKREEIYNLLLNENNWYIHMFDE